jgi:hypothetical protein
MVLPELIYLGQLVASFDSAITYSAAAEIAI